MAGERSAVNIMADTNLGGTTVRNEWKKALAKGVIPKNERLSFVGINKANALRDQGNKPQRISGQPFDDQIPVEHAEDKPPKGTTGEKKEIPSIAGGKEGQLDLSGISKQISTSMNSMRIELKNGLGTFEARLKNVEQGKSNQDKGSKSQSMTKTGTIDLRQGRQDPPPATIENTEDPGDENEGDDDDDNKEPPEGQSRVIVPDGTPDGKVVFLTPYAEKLAKQHQGLRLLKQDVRPAEVGINPYEKKTVLRRTGSRVIEITPKREIRS